MAQQIRFTESPIQDAKEITVALISRMKSITVITEHTNRIDPRNSLSWQRVQRVQAWFQRLLNNCRISKEEQTSGLLEPE